MANVGLELRQRKMQGKEMSGFKEILPQEGGDGAYGREVDGGLGEPPAQKITM